MSLRPIRQRSSLGLISKVWGASSSWSPFLCTDRKCTTARGSAHQMMLLDCSDVKKVARLGSYSLPSQIHSNERRGDGLWSCHDFTHPPRIERKDENTPNWPRLDWGSSDFEELEVTAADTFVRVDRREQTRSKQGRLVCFSIGAWNLDFQRRSELDSKWKEISPLGSGW